MIKNSVTISFVTGDGVKQDEVALKRALTLGCLCYQK